MQTLEFDDLLSSAGLAVYSFFIILILLPFNLLLRLLESLAFSSSSP